VSNANRRTIEEIFLDMAETASTASQSALNPKHGKCLCESAINTLKIELANLEKEMVITDWSEYEIEDDD